MYMKKLPFSVENVMMTDEDGFIIGYTYKIYNISYNTEIINTQCNAGDHLETPGGLYRGPPTMLINVNTIKKTCM